MAKDYDVLAKSIVELVGGEENVVSLAHCVTRCLLYTSPSPRDGLLSRMPSSA